MTSRQNHVPHGFCRDGRRVLAKRPRRRSVGFSVCQRALSLLLHLGFFDSRHTRGNSHFARRNLARSGHHDDDTAAAAAQHRNNDGSRVKERNDGTDRCSVLLLLTCRYDFFVSAPSIDLIRTHFHGESVVCTPISDALRNKARNGQHQDKRQVEDTRIRLVCTTNRLFCRLDRFGRPASQPQPLC